MNYIKNIKTNINFFCKKGADISILLKLTK